MTVQIVELAGQKMALLPVADYERLLELSEDRADILAAVAAEERRRAGEEYLPVEMVDRLLAGESPLRVWRKHRGKTIAALAREAGICTSYLSDLERRRKHGKPGQWRRLADALALSIDDILPQD